MDLNTFEALKREQESLQLRVAEKEGALKQLLEQMESEFGVKDVPSARKLLKRLEREIERGSKEYEKLLAEFKTRWGNQLEDNR